MENLALLVIDLVVLGGIILLLHSQSARIGFTPFMVCLGALTALLELQIGLYFVPFADVIIFVNPGVLVPVILVAVLTVYIVNGAVPARLLIFSILGVSVLTIGILGLYQLHLALPGIMTNRPAATTTLITMPNLRNSVGSMLAFTVDMFVIAIAYQGLHNLRIRIPEWIVIGLALLTSLWADAIVFGLVSDFSDLGVWEHLLGDLAGKTFSGIVIWLPTAYYLSSIAPKQPDYIGGEARPTFDLFFGSFEKIKLALVNTEKMLVESEILRRQEADYFQQITENINEALWLASPIHASVIYVNPAYERLFGRDAASIYADPMAFINAIHEDDRSRIQAGLHAQRTGHYRVEFRIVRPDGSIRWVRDRAFPVRDEDGNDYRIVGMSEDITERKLLEKQQLELAIAHEKVKMLRDFITDASHDLKTPLSSVNLKIYQLTRTDDPALRQKYLDDLQMLSSRLGGMINDLLTLARLDEVTDLTLDTLDLNHTIRGIVASRHPQIQEKNLTIALELENNIPLLRCDQIDLSRALGNLIDNAVRYTQAGGSITVTSQVSDTQIIFKVQDTGIGIAEADLPHIFDRFYRSEIATATDPGGTGLGLAIVRKIVEQHKGRILVESQLMVGTRFTVILPIIL